MKEDTITHSRAIVATFITAFIYFIVNGSNLGKAILNALIFSIFYGVVLIFVSLGSN